MSSLAGEGSGASCGGEAENQDDVDVALELEIAHVGHAEAGGVRLQRMGVVARDERDAHLELSRKLLFLGFVKTAQQAAPALLAGNAHRTINVTLERSERPACEIHPVVRFEHLGD